MNQTIKYTQAIDLFNIEEINSSMQKTELQILVEKMCNKQQQRNLVRKYFKNILEPIETLIPEHLMNHVLDMLGILAQRDNIFMTGLVEMIVERNDIEQSKLEIACTVILMLQLGLVRGEIVRNNLKLFAKFGLDENTKSILKQYMYLPPMLVEPLPVGSNEPNKNRGSGHLTIGNDSLILNNNHHTLDICTEFLDVLNRVQFELNTDIVRLVRNQWKDLDKPKLVNGKQESQEEYEERVRNFEQYEQLCLSTFAFLVHNDNKFYFTHKYDKRGRVYCCGYSNNYQGNDYQKAIHQLAHKELITDKIKFFD